MDQAIRTAIRMLEAKGSRKIWMGIMDLKSAFRMIPLKKKCWMLLVMKARDPKDPQQRWKYFVDKCLPFGASISCAIFQRFSNALAFLAHSESAYMLYKGITNYLDDFLNMALSQRDCNKLLQSFHTLCDRLGVPLAREKIIWATLRIVFLGILIDGELLLLCLPVDKIDRTISLLQTFIDKRKATVKEVQSLTGLRNFLHWAIYPGRTFTRRMYNKISGKCAGLKAHHHISLDAEFRGDCKAWVKFLLEKDAMVYCRPFMDLNTVIETTDLKFHTDSSAGERLSFGGVINNERWLFWQWEPKYIRAYHPSITYLELYTVCTDLFIWTDLLKNKQLVIHCYNMSVVNMVNKISSNCKRCMHLLQLLVLKTIQYNFRVTACYIETERNSLVDSLSRLQFDRFNRLCEALPGGIRVWSEYPDMLPDELWPASKIWNNLEIK